LETEFCSHCKLQQACSRAGVAAGQDSALTIKHHQSSSFGMLFIQAALSIVMFAELLGTSACSLQDHPSVDLMLPAAS
jgi:hypothetical protein